MKRSVIETVLGAIVLAVAIGFLVFGYKVGNARKITGYDITAAFSTVGGLAAGDDVAISGVKVGSVGAVQLDPKTYLAVVHLSIDPAVKLPTDTSAAISSQSLLGGHYMQLQPGSDETMMKPGDKIKYTQAPQNLEELLGKFIFSVSNNKNSGQQQAQAATPDASAAPAAGGPAVPGATAHP